MANIRLALTSPVASGGVAHFLDTPEAYSAGILLELRNNATAKFSVSYDGSVVARGMNNAVGTAGDDRYLLLVGGTINQGSGVSTALQRITGNINPLPNSSAYGISSAALNVQIADSGTHTLFASIDCSPPIILAGSGAVTMSAALYVSGQGSGATRNYAMMVGSGVSRFGGLIQGPTSTDSLNLDYSSEGHVDLRSSGDMTFRIDADSDETGKSFQWEHDSGTLLMQLTDDKRIGIGAAAQGHLGIYITGTFTSDGNTVTAEGLLYQQTVVGAPGDTTQIFGARWDANLTTQTATESINIMAQAAFFEPNITKNLTGNISLAATVYIDGAPTEGANNYAIYVGGGTCRFNGIVAVGGAVQSASTAFIVPASTTSISSLRVPHGSAPSSPTNGDIWTTTAGVFARVNGSTVQLATV